jgi:hypothetical protein
MYFSVGCVLGLPCEALSLFAPHDIFAYDETGLYWKRPVDQGLSTRHYLVERMRRRELVLSCSANSHRTASRICFLQTTTRELLYKEV